MVFSKEQFFSVALTTVRIRRYSNQLLNPTDKITADVVKLLLYMLRRLLPEKDFV
jgi:hypothetical protein